MTMRVLGYHGINTVLVLSRNHCKAGCCDTEIADPGLPGHRGVHNLYLYPPRKLMRGEITTTLKNHTTKKQV